MAEALSALERMEGNGVAVWVPGQGSSVVMRTGTLRLMHNPDGTVTGLELDRRGAVSVIGWGPGVLVESNP